MSELKEYHYLWLSFHKDRTEEWLREKLKDGFAIHHRDGDHYNNTIHNLILLERIDHLRLHNSSLKVMTGNPMFNVLIDAKVETKLKNMCKAFMQEYFKKPEKKSKYD